MVWQILKYMDSSKIQKYKYLENETLLFFKNKKIYSQYFQGNNKAKLC